MEDWLQYDGEYSNGDGWYLVGTAQLDTSSPKYSRLFFKSNTHTAQGYNPTQYYFSSSLTLPLQEISIPIDKENDWTLPFCYIRSIKSLPYSDIKLDKG